MEWLNFGKFCLMGKWWFWEIVIESLHGCLCTPLIEGSGHHVVHWWWFFICLKFCLGCPFRFSINRLSHSFFCTLLLRKLPFRVFIFFFFLVKPRKGNSIIYNHFRRGAIRLLPQTWYFFNWSMLVGSVKRFASKSINLTAPLEYIYLIMYGPTQFSLNFPFAS